MGSVFTRIMNRELKARIFHEDANLVVIADHRPKDAVHLLIVPRHEYPDLQHTPAEVLSDMVEMVKVVARRLGIEDHYRIQVNNGYGQEVPHVHIHFLSSRGADKLTWL